MPANNIFQIRRGSSSQWNSTNPVLASGEPGYDITNNLYKIGDGVNNWNNLKSVLDITGNATISGVLSATSGNFNSLQVNGSVVPTGTGSSNFITKWNGENSLTNSIIYDNGSNVGFGTSTPARNIDVVSSGGTSVGIKLNSTGAGGRSFSFFSTNNGSSLGGGKFGMYDDTAQAGRFVIDSAGNIGIGTNSPSYKLDVVGSGNFSQNLLVNNVPVSISGHLHSTTDITNFSSEVSGLLPDITGINYITSNFVNNTYTIGVTGLQPSGDYSLIGHTHTANNISDFNSSVSGLLPTIANSGDNRLLTSTGTSTGINAENNLTFDGSLLNINGSGHFTSGLYVDGNLVANTGTFDIIQLNTDNGPVSSQGQLAWNDTEGTVDIALTDTAIINIGEHEMYRIRNTTGNVLYKGQAVMASGVHANGIILPNLYTANGSVREIRFMGLVYENVNNNNNGHVIHFGHVNNIDTRGNVASNIAVGDETWVDGDILYVHPTVAGKLTNVEPKHSIAVAIILDAANNGKIFVRPTSYGHLNDNHDVSVSGATNGQFLQYNSSTDYWVPSSSGNFSTLLVNGTGVSLSGHAHTSSDITDFNSSVSGLLPVTNILGGSNITVSQSGTNFTVAVTGSLGLTTEEVDDRISNLLVAGTGISLNYNDALDTLTINTSGLQPSGNYSVVGHSHTSSDISDFNSSVSGLLSTISNSGDNRLLTSTGTSIGINAEDNATFDGTTLSVSGVFIATSGSFTQRLDAPLSYYTIDPPISGTVNDWDPGVVSDIIWASGISNARINGLVETHGSDAILLYNVGSSGNITLTHASGTANNQFLVPWLADYIISPKGGAALIVRDKVINKWRIT